MRFQQLKKNSNSILRKKMYKSGKSWVVKSTLSFMGGLVLFGFSQSTVVKADDTAGAVSQATAEVSTTQGNAGSTVAKTGSEGDAGQTTGDGANVGSTSQSVDGNSVTTPNSPKGANTAEKVTSGSQQGSGTTAGTDPTSQQNDDTKQNSVVNNGSVPETNEIQQPQALYTTEQTSKYADDQGTLKARADDWSWTETYYRMTKTLNIHGATLSTGDNNDPWKGITDRSDIQIVRFADATADSPKTATTSSDISHLFDGFTGLQELDGLNNFDTSNAENMSYMFADCRELGNNQFSDNSSHIIDLNGLDVSNVTDFSNMFLDDLTLGAINIKDWDWGNGEDFSNMFDTWDAGSGSKLTKITLPTLPSKSATNLSGMFENDQVLTTIDNLDKMDVTNVTDFSNMFSLDSALKSIDISNWNWVNGKDFSNMFAAGTKNDGNSQLNKITLPDPTKFLSSSALNLTGMFKWNKDLTDINNLDGLHVDNVTDFSRMFESDASLKTIDIHDWNWINGKNFSNMFATTSGDGSKSNLNEIILPTATNSTSVPTGVGSMLDFSYMFSGNTSLQKIDISNLSMKNTDNTTGIFSHTNNIKQITLSPKNYLYRSQLSYFGQPQANDKGKLVGWKVGDNDKLAGDVNKLYDGTDTFKDIIGNGPLTWSVDYEPKMTFNIWYVAADDSNKVFKKTTVTQFPYSDYDIKSLDSLGKLDSDANGYITSMVPLEVPLTEDKSGPNNHIDLKIPITDITIKITAKDTNGKTINLLDGKNEANFYISNDPSKFNSDALKGQFSGILKDQDVQFEKNDPGSFVLYGNNYSVGPGLLDDKFLEELQGAGYSGGNKAIELVPYIIKALTSDNSTDYTGATFIFDLVYKPQKTTDPGSGTTTGGNTSSGGSSNLSHHSSSHNSSDNSTETPEVSHSVESVKETIGTNGNISDVQLYDDDGNPVTDRTLAPSSDWYTDNLMTLDGVEYYRVATDLWAKAENVYVYHPINSKVLVDKGKLAKLVTSQGKPITDRELRSNSGWYTDRYTYINNAKYYRVSTNEFVSADDVQEY